jgi:RNA polymerase sigma-70 factor (ECF subfamily)
MSGIVRHSDDDLLRRIAAGDADAFSEFYEQWQARIYRFALHMSGSHSMAEDISQETFMNLISAAKNFDPTLGAASSYLFGIARNQVRRRFDQDRHLVPLAATDLESSNGDLSHRRNGNHSSPSSNVIVAPIDFSRKEALESIRHALVTLPAHYREVVALCDLQEMSYEQAAATLDCAVGTVRSRLHRARALLAAKLGDLRSTETKAAVGGSRN